jgi:hypothetical protein
MKILNAISVIFFTLRKMGFTSKIAYLTNTRQYF